MARATPGYIGRFAPSPTGPLHFGSLIAAVASYVDARAHGGRWLVRMEDLDPPREVRGAASQILDQLHDLALHWDGEVLFQSARLDDYQAVLNSLAERGLCYPCDCTRPQLRAMGGIYDGRCRQRAGVVARRFALRLKTETALIGFHDRVQGRFQQNVARDAGDFVVRRKDGLFAYQLAVVVDDAFQDVTHVVRGSDLIDSTPRQIYLQRLLGHPVPDYAHVPVVVNRQGQKLSKQHCAEPVDTARPAAAIHQTLRLLGQSPPRHDRHRPPAEQLQRAIENWQMQDVPKLANIPADSLADH